MTARPRGPRPGDRTRFGGASLPRLRSATSDLTWLLERGYTLAASLKLVGDRHALAARQRTAVSRAACPATRRDARIAKQLNPRQVAGQVLAIDGFNVLTTLEVALAGGVVLGCEDGTLRDLAGMHGDYRRVPESTEALVLVGERCVELGVARCRWLLDRPVSSSGKLRAFMLELAAGRGFSWEAEVVNDPDRELAVTDAVVASADGQVLDGCARWFNLARDVVEARIPGACLVELRT